MRLPTPPTLRAACGSAGGCSCVWVWKSTRQEARHLPVRWPRWALQQALHQVPPSRGWSPAPSHPNLTSPHPPTGFAPPPVSRALLDPGACLAHDLPSPLHSPTPRRAQPAVWPRSLMQVGVCRGSAGRSLRASGRPAAAPGQARGAGAVVSTAQVGTQRGSGESQGPPWGPGVAGWPAQLWGGRQALL